MKPTDTSARRLSRRRFLAMASAIAAGAATSSCTPVRLREFPQGAPARRS